jgi:uncharacterized protein
MIMGGAGFGLGLVVGLTGTGAATLIMATLSLGLGMPPASAVGTTIVTATITKFAGSFEHWRRGTVVWPIVRRFALGSIPGAVLTGILMHVALDTYAGQADLWLKRAIGAVIVLAAALMLKARFGHSRTMGETSVGTVQHRRGLLTMLGSIAGLAVAATSVGAGTFTKGMLVIATKLDARRLVGTDLMHGALLALVAASVHVTMGSVAWSAVVPISLGAIPGAVLGGKLAAKTPVRQLQTLVAGALLLIGFRLLAW